MQLGKIDLSQIECRLLNTWAGQWDVVEKFRNGEDIYSQNATVFYGREITRANPAERGMGKQIELSCGYGAAEHSILRTARNGTYGPPVILTLEEGIRWKHFYRNSHPMVCKGLWEKAATMLDALHAGITIDWAPLTIADHRVWRPGGMWMDFTSLRWNNDWETRGWQHQVRNSWRRTYHSRFVQNCIEFMGEHLISNAMVRIDQELGLKIPLAVHDDIVVVLPDGKEGEILLDKAVKIVEAVPEWMPELPLAVEAKMGKTL